MDKVALIELPSELFVEIVCGWIDLKSLVKLDSAACNHKVRSALLLLFSSSHCVFGGTTSLTGKCATTWLRSRELKVSCLSLSAYFPELVPYFRSHSRSVRHVTCTDLEVVYLMGLYIRNLVSLTFRKLEVPELSDILFLNSNLRELRLEDLREINFRHFDELSLPNLRLLSLKDSKCDDKMLGKIVCTTELLEHIEIGKCELVTDAGVIAVAQHCPQLRTFGLASLPISDNALSLVVELCPSVSCLNLSANGEITDRGVRAIAQNLHNLRRLSISNCTRLTDVSLEHLTNFSSSTLQELRATGLSTVRVDVLLALLRKCPHFHALSLDCDLDAYRADIIPHMCNLETLITYAVLSDDVLCMMANHCKKLRQLGIYSVFKVAQAFGNTPVITNDTRFMSCAGNRVKFAKRKYTEKGLLAILDGLPQLRVLAVQEQEVQQGLLMPFVQNLWRRVRPQISFEVNPYYFVFDCLENHQ